MGKIETKSPIFDTGRKQIRVTICDKIILMLLVIAGIESIMYFGEYWFLGGHRKQLLLFLILSYAVFRTPVRSVFSWIYYCFIKLPVSVKASQNSTVDVLTTAMPGEPYEMFVETLSAIQRIKHPHTSYLLDGGNDTNLKELCKKLNVIHVDCSGVKGAKAGKINYCLHNMAKSDFVLILDPDHIPEPDFIDKTLPQMEDCEVGFVQVVQAYHNERENNIAHGAAEQTYGFYGPLMLGLNGLNMAIAIGANCFFRRKALDSIGGHAVHLAEDACTSMRLHASGWKSRFVPYRASYGLVPADLQTFFNQQLKWACGMFDLFAREYPTRFRKLSTTQKIYYFFAGTFYLSGLSGLISVTAPIIFLFMQIYAVEMPVGGFFLHVAPYIVMSLSISLFIQRWYTSDSEKGFPWRAMLLEKGTWHIYALSLLYFLIGKKVPYLPTPKSGTGKTSAMLLLPHMIIIFFSMLAIIYPLIFYHHIEDGTWLMSFFAAVNILSLLPVVYWGLKR